MEISNKNFNSVIIVWSQRLDYKLWNGFLYSQQAAIGAQCHKTFSTVLISAIPCRILPALKDPAYAYHHVVHQGLTMRIRYTQKMDQFRSFFAIVSKKQTNSAVS